MGLKQSFGIARQYTNLSTSPREWFAKIEKNLRCYMGGGRPEGIYYELKNAKCDNRNQDTIKKTNNSVRRDHGAQEASFIRFLIKEEAIEGSRIRIEDGERPSGGC